jgi:hypothetical protein
MLLKSVQDIIKSAAEDSGLYVMFEYPVVFWDTYDHGRIDVAWFRENEQTPAAVFEIEGINVQKKSLTQDMRKFMWANCENRYLVLYTTRHGATLVKNNEKELQNLMSRLTNVVDSAPEFTQPKVLPDFSNFRHVINQIAKIIGNA